jgi:hypothetical protein
MNACAAISGCVKGRVSFRVSPLCENICAAFGGKSRRLSEPERSHQRNGQKQSFCGCRSGYGAEQSVFVASASANRLLKSAKVMARVSELQAKVAEKYEITIESMIREFAEAAADAKEESNTVRS